MLKVHQNISVTSEVCHEQEKFQNTDLIHSALKYLIIFL